MRPLIIPLAAIGLLSGSIACSGDDATGPSGDTIVWRNPMRLDPKAFGLAAGIAAVVLFVICAIAVALAPDATTALGGFLFHADLSAFTRSLTWGNFIGGLLGWGAGTAIVSWLVAVLYNRLGGARA